MSSTYTRLNEQIRAPFIRVIAEDGTQLGTFERLEAIRLARDQELDLVEISPNADPPVAKIINWGKYNYQRTKQLQKNKRSTKSQDLKQIRFGLKISDHDLGIKLKKAQVFLQDGHKVKLTAFYRGREMAHRDIGFQLAQKVLDQFGESIVVDQQPQLLGKQLSFVIRSNPHAKAQTQNP
ncbi:MAG TPA: translation initiation factor IF-3 [Candidatus Binatia bacterium]|nr:translation initiation factor IF-3 [Candidatus Binatia bacterium]